MSEKVFCLPKRPPEGVVTRARAAKLEQRKRSLGREEREGQEEEEEEEKSSPPEQIVQDDVDEFGAHDRFDGTEVVTGLYFGGEGCAADHTGRSALGITHVLAVISPFEQSFEPDPEMVQAGTWRTYERENRPTADLLNVLDECIDFIDDALGSKGCVCVVSLEGASRSVAVCMAYLMRTLGMTLKAANELVRLLKPNAFVNRGFWRQLVAYEVKVRGRASLTEDELPGAILFEREALDLIMAKFRDSNAPPLNQCMSPTTATRIDRMTLLGSPDNKRKAYERSTFGWGSAARPEDGGADDDDEEVRLEEEEEEERGGPPHKSPRGPHDAAVAMLA